MFPQKCSCQNFRMDFLLDWVKSSWGPDVAHGPGDLKCVSSETRGTRSPPLSSVSVWFTLPPPSLLCIPLSFLLICRLFFWRNIISSSQAGADISFPSCWSSQFFFFSVQQQTNTAERCCSTTAMPTPERRRQRVIGQGLGGSPMRKDITHLQPEITLLWCLTLV